MGRCMLGVFFQEHSPVLLCCYSALAFTAEDWLVRRRRGAGTDRKGTEAPSPHSRLWQPLSASAQLHVSNRFASLTWGTTPISFPHYCSKWQFQSAFHWIVALPVHVSTYFCSPTSAWEESRAGIRKWLSWLCPLSFSSHTSCFYYLVLYDLW